MGDRADLRGVADRSVDLSRCEEAPAVSADCGDAELKPQVLRVWEQNLAVYGVAFVVNVFSRTVVGWQPSRSLRSDLAIDALEMAIFDRQRAGADLSELIHHSDRGVNICP